MSSNLAHQVAGSLGNGDGQPALVGVQYQGGKVRPAGRGQQVRTGIEVVARFSPVSFLLRVFRPTIRVDGKTHKASWGKTEYAHVSPGLHSVEVSFSHPLQRKAGRKQIYLTVARGQVRRLQYQAPQLSFLQGSLRETFLRR